MKNRIILMGTLAGLFALMLFSGCAGSTDSNYQETGTQEYIQTPAGQDPSAQNLGPQDNGQNTERVMGGPRGNMGAQLAEACSGKAAGEACAIVFGNRSANGTCADRNGNITCQPTDGNLAQRGGMPGGRNEAFMEACSGKGAGDVCTVTMRNQSMDGTCAGRSGNITCVPNNIGPQGSQGNPGAGVPPMDP